MYSGHWLVADMDGTLTPTPTKAGGKYFSFSDSINHFSHAPALSHPYHSCLPALRRFITLGGSLCVVSTAGRRIWRQMYDDLAPALYGSSPALPSDATTTTSTAASETTVPGALLVCGFTGAALFRSRDPRAVWADMSQSAATTLPPPAIGLEEWEAYRLTAGARTVADHTAHAPAVHAPTTLDAEVRDAAVTEGRQAVIRFFEHASFVSGHDVHAAQAFFEDCLSTKYHAVYTEMLRRCLEEIRATQPGVLEAMTSRSSPLVPLCFDALRVFDEVLLTTHGTYLAETNDALVDAQAVDAGELVAPCEDAERRRAMPAAQVVVMGIPMRFYDAIFPESGAGSPSAAWACCPTCAAKGAGARARLTLLGLEIKSQPNSVCIHRRGIDKATCVRWLQHHADELGPTRHFSLDRALGFGDVPASVDRPLWQFPPMQFVSLSTKPHAGMDPQRDPLPERGFYEVGGEEEGTACFLDALLQACERDDGATDGTASLFTEDRVCAAARTARGQVAAWASE